VVDKEEAGERAGARVPGNATAVEPDKAKEKAPDMVPKTEPAQGSDPRMVPATARDPVVVPAAGPGTTMVRAARETNKGAWGLFIFLTHSFLCKRQ